MKPDAIIMVNGAPTMVDFKTARTAGEKDANRNAIDDLSKEDIGILFVLATCHRVTCFKHTCEKPNDELYANELKTIRNICEKLKIAFEQKP